MPGSLSAKHIYPFLTSNLLHHHLFREASQVYTSLLPSPMEGGVWGEGRKDTMLLLLSRFSRVQLCDPIDGSPPGSPVLGILQARTPEWVAIFFSNA